MAIDDDTSLIATFYSSEKTTEISGTRSNKTTFTNLCLARKLEGIRARGK